MCGSIEQTVVVDGWVVLLLPALLCFLTAPSGCAPAGEGNPDLQAVLKVAAKAPPLPKPAGKVVRVGSVAELRKAVAAAEPGTTILLADGTYVLEELLIRQDRLSLRGESGDRDKVILDGGGKFTKVIRVRGAKDLLIADLTIRNCKQYGIFVLGDSDVQRLRVYNVKFHNIWVRGLKGTHAARVNDSSRKLLPPETVRQIRPAGGEVRYCLFVNDRVKPYDDSFGGNYVSGIDMMHLKDWVIADNVFVGIRGKTGGARGAIFIWYDSENVIAERNVFVNCDNAICYGNPHGGPVHMTGGIIRNNFIVGGKRRGLEIVRTRDTMIYHNTVVARSVDDLAVHVFLNVGGGQFFNNLVRGRVRLADEVKRGDNVVGELDGYFVGPEIGDLHLTRKALDALAPGRPLKDVSEDFDRQKRNSPPDVGADECSLPATEPQDTSSQSR